MATAREFLIEQYRRRNLGEHHISCDEFISTYFAIEREGIVRKAELFPVLAKRLHLPTAVSDQLFLAFQTIYPGMAKPTADALACVSTLHRQGLRCAVVTNGEAVVQRPKIGALGLKPFLAFALISSEAGFRKPDRKIFEMAASKLGLQTDQCVFVGDNPTADVAGAANAGMHTIYFGDLADWPSNLTKPEWACTSLLHVPEIVGRINGPKNARPTHSDSL